MKAIVSSEIELSSSASIAISGSKSESNRLLILKALYPNISIDNLSTSDDTCVLKKALARDAGTIDIHHAGTAMRFLTAYFASKPSSEVILTGSERMRQRPIGILVDALRELGAQIDYVDEEGYPPLKITGTSLPGKAVSLAANVSSQYITALMLIAPSLPFGLKIELKGEVTSRPYIEMTLSLLQKCGIQGEFSGNEILIPFSEKIKDTNITVESDWSSASYFYSLAALSPGSKIVLSSYRKESLQGDSALAEIYAELGVQTNFDVVENSIELTNTKTELPEQLELDLANTPDIAQTIAVTCFGLGMGCYLTGLHTLKIKETDRLVALKTELEKLGAKVVITNDSLRLLPASEYRSHVEIATYNDHRMAMAYAPLAVKIPLIVNNSEVVSKSYPDFWKDLAAVGIEVCIVDN